MRQKKMYKIERCHIAGWQSDATCITIAYRKRLHNEVMREIHPDGGLVLLDLKASVGMCRYV